MELRICFTGCSFLLFFYNFLGSGIFDCLDFFPPPPSVFRSHRLVGGGGGGIMVMVIVCEK